MSESVREIDPRVNELMSLVRAITRWDLQYDMGTNDPWSEYEVKDDEAKRDQLARELTARLSPESERDRVRVSEDKLYAMLRWESWPVLYDPNSMYGDYVRKVIAFFTEAQP